MGRVALHTLAQGGHVIQVQVALEKIALVFAGKNIPTHNKANALGQQKAPLVPRSAFCCR